MIGRDALVEFVENRRVAIAAFMASLLVILLLILVVALRSESGTKKRLAAEASARKAAAVGPDELWMPAEPLPVPGIQFFREHRERWSFDEAKEWYTEPDEGALAALRSAGKSLVDELLESVP